MGDYPPQYDPEFRYFVFITYPPADAHVPSVRVCMLWTFGEDNGVPHFLLGVVASPHIWLFCYKNPISNKKIDIRNFLIDFRNLAET